MGRFTVRLPDTLHRELEQNAKQEGVSLNQYLVYALTKHTSSAYTVQLRSLEEIEAGRERFEAQITRLKSDEQVDIDLILSEREVEDVDEKTADLVRRMRGKMSQMMEKSPQ